jgi:hypothetical protein
MVAFADPDVIANLNGRADGTASLFLRCFAHAEKLMAGQNLRS